MGKWISTFMIASLFAVGSPVMADDSPDDDTGSAAEDTNADGGVAWGQWRLEVDVNGGNRVAGWLPLGTLELFIDGTETFWDTDLTEDVYADPMWETSVPIDDWTHTKLNLDGPILIAGQSSCGEFLYELDVNWIELVLHGSKGSVPLPAQVSEDGECVYAPTLTISLDSGFLRRPSRR